MIAEKSNQTAVGSAPQKRSLFNKPSWSKPQALSDDTELFHRSSETYADLAAEAERARKRKLARKEREIVRQNLTGERASKRRRTSEGEDDDDDDSSTDGSSSHSGREDINTSPTRLKTDPVVSSSSPRKSSQSPKALIKRYEARITASKEDLEQRRRSKALDIIDLEDEQCASASPGQEPRWDVVVEPAALPEDDSQPGSDEEFPELARQAREKARRKRLEEDIVSTTTTSQDGQLPLHQPTPPHSQPDPVLQILITSDIPSTVPLIVSRRLSQRLKDVRLAWVKRQSLTPDSTHTVFLTWRGKRVFDVTTCKSLGITGDMIGRTSLKGGSWEKEEGQIHMEAMTTKMLEAYKISKRNETNNQEEDATQEAAVVGQDHEAQVRIILKAKGLKDFKLQVRPSTFISKILNAFRSQYHIGIEKDVFVSFDGERLSPDSRIVETEISDMDTLEIYCR